MRSERFYSLVSSLSLAIASLSSLYLGGIVYSSGKAMVIDGFTILDNPEIDLDLRLDGVSVTLAIIASVLGLAISVYSWEYMSGDRGYGRFFALVSAFVGGMNLLVLSDSLVFMFAGWELTGLCSYALISHYYDDKPDKGVGRPGRMRLGVPMFFTPTHSGVRALAFTMFGDAWLLVGIALIAYYSGTTSLTYLLNNPSQWIPQAIDSKVLHIALGMLVVGALAKSAQFPFHEWLLTAMTAPTPVSALIHAATMVNAGVYLFFRVTSLVASYVYGIGATTILELELLYHAVLAVSLTTSILLSIIALASDELKVILAASTSSQLGLMFAAISVSGLLLLDGETEEAYLASYAAITHLLSHAVFKATLFLSAGYIIHTVHSKYLEDMRGFLSKSKTLTIAFIVSSLSLAGIPPTIGFFSKDSILHVFSLGGWLVLALGLISFATTSLYTGRLLGVLLSRESEQESSTEHGGHDDFNLMVLVCFSLAMASLLLGVTWLLLIDDTTALLSGAMKQSYTPHLTPTIAIASIFLSSSILILGYTVSSGGVRNLTAITSNRFFSVLADLAYDRFLITPIIYKLTFFTHKVLASLSLGIHRMIDDMITPAVRTLAGVEKTGSLLYQPHWLTTQTRPIEHKSNNIIVSIARSSKRIDQILDNIYHNHMYIELLVSQSRIIESLLNTIYHVLLVLIASKASAGFRQAVPRGDTSQISLAYIVAALTILVALLVIIAGS